MELPLQEATPVWRRYGHFAWILLALVPFFASNSCSVESSVAPGNFEWIMLNVSNGEAQAEANLLRFDDGFVALIDAGEARGLVPELERVGVRRIDAIYVSHAHRDHYNGILPLLNSPIRIGRVYLNVPDRHVCDREIPWGCDWAEVHRLLQRLEERGIPVSRMANDDILHETGNTRLQVVYAFDGSDRGFNPSDVNDTSVVMRLVHARTITLFTGDMNRPLSEYLVKRGDVNLRAAILKVPHHGIESVAANVFFEAVAPSDALVSTYTSIYRGHRGARVRSWMQSHNVRTHVTAANGRLRVLFDDQGAYRITSEW